MARPGELNRSPLASSQACPPHCGDRLSRVRPGREPASRVFAAPGKRQRSRGSAPAPCPRSVL
ncbi:hypothetical protein ABTN57_19225, partial [Acinetobacter baumannii]